MFIHKENEIWQEIIQSFPVKNTIQRNKFNNITFNEIDLILNKNNGTYWL